VLLKDLSKPLRPFRVYMGKIEENQSRGNTIPFRIYSESKRGKSLKRSRPYGIT
jgi:hypothetical protein